MNIKNKLKNFYLPINTSSLALFLSVLAIGYVASATNTPCLQAQSTCAIGGDNEFTGNISLKGNTPHSALLKVDPLISGDIELTLPNQTGTLALASSTLAGNKIVETDINGDLTTNSYLPTGIGTAGQFLKVNPGATSLIYADISEVPTLTNDAPYLKVNGAGEIDSSSTLTASTPLKSSATGQITASDLDITTDITPGSALQEIRVNAAGNALEYFTPGASGGAYTLIDSGNLIHRTGSTDEVFTCWYGNTLDATKKYKLIFDGGTGMNIGAIGYIPSFIPLKGDCSTGTKTEWESNSYYANAQQHIGNRATSTYNYMDSSCRTVQGGDANTSSSLSSNIQGHINFSAADNGNDYGFWSEYKMSAVTTNVSGIVQGTGSQMVTGTCIVWDQNYTNPFSLITGFQHYFEGGSGAPLTRSWALYEINY